MRGPSLPPGGQPDLASYDHILVFTSGGKDSLACLLRLLEAGADARRVELHHHEVDGRGAPFMDWPVTGAYVAATADAFDVPLYRSWREGGFEREMLRHEAATARILFETPHGVMGAGGAGRPGTRLAFPQVSADLSVRWCSPALKIDVGAAVIRNQDRFLGRRILVVTGERAEESPARARYASFEPHRSDTRGGARRPRHVDHWRPVHAWSATRVWDTLRRHGVRPHPAYPLGLHELHLRLGLAVGDDPADRARHLRADRPLRGAVRPHHPARSIDPRARRARSSLSGRDREPRSCRPGPQSQLVAADRRLTRTVAHAGWCLRRALRAKLGGGPARAQEARSYPNRVVRFIVPFPSDFASYRRERLARAARDHVPGSGLGRRGRNWSGRAAHRFQKGSSALNSPAGMA